MTTDDYKLVQIHFSSLKSSHISIFLSLGNPYKQNVNLKSIASSSWIPEEIKDEMINYAARGQEAFQSFVTERMLETSEKSVWDPMPKLKLKAFSNWSKKARIKVGEKVIKIKEERQLFARMMVIQEHRPDVVPPLEESISTYEMSVVARAFCTSDGSLIIPKDKSSLMKAIVGYARNPDIFDSDDLNIGEIFDHAYQDADASMSIEESFPASDGATENTEGYSPDAENSGRPTKIIIIDAMAVLQCMKKKPSTKKLRNLCDDFLTRIDRMVSGYDEARVLFDPYPDVDHTLKDKTHQNRSVTDEGFDVYMNMPLAMSVKELLSSKTSKRVLTALFGKELISRYSSHEYTHMIVAYNDAIQSAYEDKQINQSHEEADTLIPNQVVDCAKTYAASLLDIDVISPDTDVLLLLMHVAASGYLGVHCNLKLISGTANKRKTIDIMERVLTIGPMKSKGLLGFHEFSGSDWGGKTVGITKKNMADAYLNLVDDSEVVKAFNRLGKLMIYTVYIYI